MKSEIWLCQSLKKLMHNKSEIRKHLLNKRKKLSDSFTKKHSETICKKCIESTEITKKKHVVGFCSIHNEPDLTPFYEFCLSNNVAIYFPKWVLGEYVCVKVHTLNDLQIGKYKILEPIKNSPLLSMNDDPETCWLIPGIAFDNNFHRIGYGKGVYDTLLKNRKALKVGICYPFQLVATINASPSDIALDGLITS